MSTDRDDALARRYRAANAALDERPSAATRTAILAAAARQVEARPQLADAPRVARRTRWPLAAAAAVLLSTLAVMMANRTEQEMPSFTAPAERTPQADAAAPTIAVASPPSSGSAAPLPAPPIAAAPAPVAKRSTTPGALEERSSVAAAPVERLDAGRSDATSPAVSASSAERALEAVGTEARQELTTAAPAAPPRAAPPARSAPAPAAAGAMPAPESAAEKPATAAADRAPARERAPAAQGAARVDAARDFEGSAPMWLERIVKLRSEGREAEADAELKRFRERYPGVEVSPAALPGGAAGTR